MEKVFINHAYKIVFVIFLIMLIAWSVLTINTFIKEGKMNTTQAVVRERLFYDSYTYRNITHTFYDCELSYKIDDKQYTARAILQDINTGDYVTLKIDSEDPTIFQVAASRELIILIEVVLIFMTVVMGIVNIPSSNRKKEEGEVIS